MIYTLTVSPSLDYYMNNIDFRGGDIPRAADTRIELGGKGLNVSRVLSVFGVPSTAIIVTGGFVGEKIRSLCDDYKLSYINIASSVCSRINVKFPNVDMIIPIEGVNAIAPPLSDDELEELKNVLSKLSVEDMLIISGKCANLDIKKLNTKAKLVFDVSGQDLKDAITLSPFLVKPNCYELCEYFDRDPTSAQSKLKEMAEKIFQSGTKNVLVTADSDHMVFVSEGFYKCLPAHKGEQINSVGAGDSSLAGFIAGLTLFDDLSKALDYANAAGAAAAFSEGLPDIEKIRLFLENEKEI
jgi:1-phosphofructokinase